MLHYLAEYARRENLSVVPGLKPKTVRWLLVFDTQGRFLSVVDLAGGEKKSRGREFPACPELPGAWLLGGGRANFLVEALSTLALFTKEDPPDAKSVRKHDFFLGLLEQAAAAVPEFSTVAQALRSPAVLDQIRTALREAKAKPTDPATVALGLPDGKQRILVAEDAWHGWWQGFLQSINEDRGEPAAGKGSPRQQSRRGMLDLLTAEPVVPLPTHNKIEKLSDVGGLATGDSLIGFDKDAYTSFGLEQAENAAMCQDSAKTYITALNHILAHRCHRLTAVKVGFWYSGRVPPELDPQNDFGLSDLGPAAEDEQEGPDDASRANQAESFARRALNAIRSGERPDLKDYRYYAITISGNSGRVVIRDFTEGRFEDLARHVDQWLDDLAVVNHEGRVQDRFRFTQLLAAPVREPKDVSAPLVTALWRSAVRGLPIPHTVMAQTLHRVRIDFIQGESPRVARMALLKAFVNRNERLPKMNPELNPVENHPAYVSGRIMALLAGIQKAANPDVGAGVVQRYYAAASATPALVLGRLIRTAQIAHLPKIEQEGLRRWFENQLAELWSRLQTAPPRVLTLEEQTLFAMGYYHQLATRAKPAENGEPAATPAE
ncbi:MAG: type I-C CRISPR-associated protein Cas8c/Csd1 [Thermogutta sp.]|nr:type I-C CRISPR-associated protein Cas8c/Csd1 [Thermogutta sp.]